MDPLQHTLKNITLETLEALERLAVENHIEFYKTNQGGWLWKNTGILWKTGEETRLETLQAALVELEVLELQFIVHATPLVPEDELHELDRTEGPPAQYTCYRAENEEQALDEFHQRNAIKVLDDYEITVERQYQTPTPD